MKALLVLMRHSSEDKDYKCYKTDIQSKTKLRSKKTTDNQAQKEIILCTGSASHVDFERKHANRKTEVEMDQMLGQKLRRERTNVERPRNAEKPLRTSFDDSDVVENAGISRQKRLARQPPLEVVRVKNFPAKRKNWNFWILMLLSLLLSALFA